MCWVSKRTVHRPHARTKNADSTHTRTSSLSPPAAQARAEAEGAATAVMSAAWTSTDQHFTHAHTHQWCRKARRCGRVASGSFMGRPRQPDAQAHAGSRSATRFVKSEIGDFHTSRRAMSTPLPKAVLAGHTGHHAKKFCITGIHIHPHTHTHTHTHTLTYTQVDGEFGHALTTQWSHLQVVSDGCRAASVEGPVGCDILAASKNAQRH
jgi:hypothetical protein